MKGYFVFIVNSSRKASEGRVTVIAATTPESEAALRNHIVSVKVRMRDLELWEEVNQGRSQADPPPSAIV